jgi:hypothetical protein
MGGHGKAPEKQNLPRYSPAASAARIKTTINHSNPSDFNKRMQANFAPPGKKRLGPLPLTSAKPYHRLGDIIATVGKCVITSLMQQ